jgi:hypothetical protein
MRCRVAWQRFTDVSEEFTVSIFSIGEQTQETVPELLTDPTENTDSIVGDGIKRVYRAVA